MTYKYKIVIKFVIQITLFVVFWFLFGRQSLNRYNAQKVLVTTEEEQRGTFSVPAVTICPINVATSFGFRNLSNQDLMLDGNLVWNTCKGLKQDAIVKCIKENTYDQASTIVKVTQGFLSDDPLPFFKWIPDYTPTAGGMCYTLESNSSMGTGQTNSVFKIELDHQSFSVAFIIHIHDPRYFVVNMNPLLPFNMLLQYVQEKPKFKVFSLLVIQHKNLDVPSKPCNPDPTYSFTCCIKESISAQVGCRLAWDSWTDRARPVCHHLTQYRSAGSCSNCSTIHAKSYSVPTV